MGPRSAPVRPRCPHVRDVCTNRALHPRHDVVHLRNAEGPSSSLATALDFPDDPAVYSQVIQRLWLLQGPRPLPCLFLLYSPPFLPSGPVPTLLQNSLATTTQVGLAAVALPSQANSVSYMPRIGQQSASSIIYPCPPRSSPFWKVSPREAVLYRVCHLLAGPKLSKLPCLLWIVGTAEIVRPAGPVHLL